MSWKGNCWDKAETTIVFQNSQICVGLWSEDQNKRTEEVEIFEHTSVLAWYNLKRRFSALCNFFNH